MAWFAHLIATAVGVLLVHRLTGRGRWRASHQAVAAAGIAMIALLTFRASDPPAGFLFSDFRIAYHPAGRAVLDDPQQLHGLLEKGITGFVNLPAVAWLLAPLGALPEAAAIGVFTAIGVAATIAAWRLLCRVAGLGPQAACMLALLFAANGPLLYSLKEGNTSHLVLLGLASALALLQRGRHTLAGAVLGACAVLKPPLALFGLYFLLRRDRGGLAGFAAIAGAFALASLLLAGWSLNLHWFEVSVLRFSREWLATYNVQSLPAFVLRLDPGAQQYLHDWTSVPPVGDGQRLAGKLLHAAVLVVAAIAWWRSEACASGADAGAAPRRRDLQYLLVLCLALLASPLSWSHYYAWMLVPVAFLLGPSGLGAGPASRVLGWVAIALVTPLVRAFFPPEGDLLAAYRAIGVSHLLFGGLLLFALVAARLAAPLVPRRPVHAGTRGSDPGLPDASRPNAG